MKNPGQETRSIRDWAAAAVALATVAVFWPAVGNDFVFWDDHPNFLANPHYRGLGWEQLRWMFTSRLLEHYHPLTWLSAAVDYRLWGMDPRGYHLTNVLLHAANAALVLRLFTRLAQAPREGTPGDSPWLKYAPAIFAALCFSLHPLRVEVVAWVSERRMLLATVWGLLALLAYLDRKRWRALGFYALALLSHEMWVTFPAVLALIDLRDGRRAWKEKVPFLILACVDALVVLHGQAQKTGSPSYGIGDRLAQIVYGLSFYLGKTALPAGLSPLYELPSRAEYLASPTFAAHAFLLIAITGASWAARRRWPSILAAWACYVVAVLPVQGLIPSGPQIAADRYTYFPMIGAALIAGELLRLGMERRGVARPRLALAAAAAVLAALAWGARRQIGVWHDTETLWARALQVSPASVGARVNLAAYFRSRGRLPEAVAQLERLLEHCGGRCRSIHHDLGVLLAQQGRVDDALAHFSSSLDHDEDGARARLVLGEALMQNDRPAQAAEQFRLAVERRPLFVDAMSHWGVALAAQGKPREAIERLERALRLDPRHAKTHGTLGSLLASRGRAEEGLRHLRQATAELDDAGLHNNMGLALAHLGRTSEAIEAFKRALRVDPGYAAARENLRVARSSPAPGLGNINR